MAQTPVTLNDLEGHSPVAGLFKCDSSTILADFNRQPVREVSGVATSNGIGRVGKVQHPLPQCRGPEFWAKFTSNYIFMLYGRLVHVRETNRFVHLGL